MIWTFDIKVNSKERFKLESFFLLTVKALLSRPPPGGGLFNFQPQKGRLNREGVFQITKYNKTLKLIFSKNYSRLLAKRAKISNGGLVREGGSWKEKGSLIGLLRYTGTRWNFISHLCKSFSQQYEFHLERRRIKLEEYETKINQHTAFTLYWFPVRMRTLDPVPVHLLG